MPNRVASLIGLLVFWLPAQGQQYGPPKITQDVGITQRLGATIPLDLSFRNETGQSVTLASYFGDQPVVLALVYYRCPSLCSLTLNGLVHVLGRIDFQPAHQYRVVVVSIDPTETPALAAAKKAEYAQQSSKAASFQAGWHFLTGQQDSIQRLAEAVGFRYRWDAASRQFVHAGGIIVATPGGQLSKYFYGVVYVAEDMRLALVEASARNIGTPVDQFLLFCFHYDPAQGKYSLTIVNILKALGVLTIAGIGFFLRTLMRQKQEVRHV